MSNNPYAQQVVLAKRASQHVLAHAASRWLARCWHRGCAMILWPKGNGTIDVMKAIRGVRAVVEQGYAVVRSRRRNLDYEGYDTPAHIIAGDGTPADKRFKAAYLAYHEERDRDLLDVALLFLFNLGVQQGIRMQREATDAWKDLAERLEALLQNAANAKR